MPSFTYLGNETVPAGIVQHLDLAATRQANPVGPLSKKTSDLAQKGFHPGLIVGRASRFAKDGQVVSARLSLIDVVVAWGHTQNALDCARQSSSFPPELLPSRSFVSYWERIDCSDF